MTPREKEIPLIVVGGWGVDASMLEPLVCEWPGLVRFVSLTEDLMDDCESVADLAALLIARYPEPAVWMGWSLGAQVVMAAASARNTPVRRVITLAGFPKFVAGEGWTGGMPVSDFVAFCRDFKSQPEKTWRRFHQLLVKGSAESEVGTARRDLAPWIAVGQLASNHALEQGLQWLETTDQRSLWGAVTVPTLHLQAGLDALVSPSFSECALSSSASVRTIPNMTHWPRGEAGQQCAEAIYTFARLKEVA